MKRIIVLLGLMAAATIAAILPSSPAMAASSCTSFSHVYNTKGRWVEIPSIGAETENFNCVLGVGNNSGAVSALQHSLNECYLRPNGKTLLAVDGDFGAKTKSALIYAQGKAGAVQDGVYGPETRDKMLWYGYAGYSSCGRRA